MPAFNGTLRSNEVYNSLFNMILSQQVFADNIQKHQTLVDEAKQEAGLYGDTKIFYAADVLYSDPWGATAAFPKGGVMDNEYNILEPFRAPDPKQQALIIDTFRQVRLTTDDYMSKRAWSTESAFADFTSVMLDMLSQAKKIHEGALYNVFIGTTEAEGSTAYPKGQEVLIDVNGARGNASTEEEANRLEAEEIARDIADLLVKMGDYSREFNDYGFMRSYDESNIKVIWNSKFVNKIRKVDLPSLFHRDGLVDKFDEHVLPAKYFGEKNAAKVLAANNDGSYLSAIEKKYTLADTSVVSVFPGEPIPASVDIEAGEGYKVTDDVICKIVTKLPPMLSAFSVSTSFQNARGLFINRYLTWGYSTLEYLKSHPFITVKVKPSENDGD